MFYERCGTCAPVWQMELSVVRRSDRAPCALLARAFEMARACSGEQVVRQVARCRKHSAGISATVCASLDVWYTYTYGTSLCINSAPARRRPSRKLSPLNL